LLRHDTPARTPLGWAAANGRPTSCAAFQPEIKTSTQTRSRVNFDQTAGPGIDDNLALDSPMNRQTPRRRPAGDTSDVDDRPVAEA